jgi:pseudaminic acid synthase
MKKIKIGNRMIGEGEPVLIVAEISCNHLQKKEVALELIEEAKEAGADAVKFQTYTPDTITLDCDNEYFKIKGTVWEGKTLYELYQEAYTPWEWFPDLKKKAEEEGLIFFSSPFDETAVDFLEELGVPAYKIASFEINHIPMIRKIAKTGKPIIFSTGLAKTDDIDLALETIRSEGNNQIAVLKCTSAYPTPLSEMNLETIHKIEKKFKVIAGLSDHSLGVTVPAASVALGAKIIEKHFIMDRKAGGPDAGFSLEPAEFKKMVYAVREVEQAIGTISFELTAKAKEHRFFMRSIFVVKDMRKGEEFTKDNIRVIRPDSGVHPKHYEEILGKKAKQDIKRGTPLREEDIE